MRVLETPLSEVGKGDKSRWLCGLDVALMRFDNVPVYDGAVPLGALIAAQSHIQGRPIIFLRNTQGCTLS